MEFFKRLFGGGKKATVPPMQGVGYSQTQAEQDVTREQMEAEVTSQRERRADKAAADSPDNPPATP